MSVKDIKAMEAHKNFHQDYYDYIEKLNNQSDQSVSCQQSTPKTRLNKCQNLQVKS